MIQNSVTRMVSMSRHTTILGALGGVLALSLASQEAKAGLITLNNVQYTYTTRTATPNVSTPRTGFLNGTITFTNVTNVITASSLFMAVGVIAGTGSTSNIAIGSWGTSAAPITTVGTYNTATRVYTVTANDSAGTSRTLGIQFAASPFANQTATAVNPLTMGDVTAGNGGNARTGGGIVANSTSGNFTTTQAPAPAIGMGLIPLAVVVLRRKRTSQKQAEQHQLA